jgi:AcrR family transcriptional regulator
MSIARDVRAAAKQMTVDAIVDTAIAMIDEGGLPALNMRTLAERCQIGTMTLYRYLNTKEELLAAVADRYLGEMHIPENSGPTWQGRLKATFTSLHKLISEHPGLAPFLASYPVTSPAGFRALEVVLATLRAAGMSDHDAVSAFHALRSLTAGFSQREVVRRAAHIDPQRRAELIRRLPADDFPNSRELADSIASPSFEDLLDLFISGLELRLARA